MRTLPSLLAACMTTFLAGGALAQQRDVVDDGKAPPPRTVERPWLYTDDATIPGQWQAVVGSELTLSNAGERSVTRPFSSNVAPNCHQGDATCAAAVGGLGEVNAEVGLLPMLSVGATGVIGFGDALEGGMTAGVRFAPFAAARHHFRLVLGGGYLLDRTEASGMFARVAATYDAGPVRLAGTLHGEHVFAEDRDAVDLLVMLGASYRLAGPVRLGLEYVGQDLEEIGTGDDAEGGARHFIGPTASLELLQRRLFIDFGPAVGLSYQSPRLVGRLALAYAF